MIVKSINSILHQFGVQIKQEKALSAEKSYLDAKYKGAVEIYNVYKKYVHKKLNNGIEGMVFSKDRTMQLHALLTTYIDDVSNHCPLVILYKATNEKSKRAYEDLKMEFGAYHITFIAETNFYGQVLKWLSGTGADRIFFVTDDAVFLDSFDLNNALLFNPLETILSLTKGFDQTFCFPLNKEQRIPDIQKKARFNGENFNFWIWRDSPDAPNWSYPLSVDGNFFLREEMLQVVKNISFKNPNSLEASLQIFVDFFNGREGVCFDKAKLINVPCNLVQNVFKNRSTGLFSAEELQDLWDEGKRIDVSPFQGMSSDEATYVKYCFKNKV